MDCPNCDREVVEIIPQSGDLPEEYDAFCHIGKNTNDGRIVYVIH